VIKDGLANGRLFRNHIYPHYEKAYTVLESLSDKYNVGVDAIALRFCIDTVDPFRVLSGASSTEQVIQNSKAEGFYLDADEIKLLKSLTADPVAYWKERKQLSWS
jgi:aryl-alcohol dehydrogenase-like predicted oxidoreductase